MTKKELKKLYEDYQAKQLKLFHLVENCFGKRVIEEELLHNCYFIYEVLNGATEYCGKPISSYQINQIKEFMEKTNIKEEI